ncbi:MAG: hypothetical protein WCF23_16035 [Candidatus Nitrosopolaris sp.]|jgi:hypothetical protein
MDIGTLIGLTANIRVKNGKIKSYSEGINEDLDQIKAAVNNYQHKLKSAIAGIEAINDGMSVRSVG